MEIEEGWHMFSLRRRGSSVVEQRRSGLNGVSPIGLGPPRGRSRVVLRLMLRCVFS